MSARPRYGRVSPQKKRMDFFQAQDQARRNSRMLVLWFALAVLGIISAVYLLAAVTLHAGVSPDERDSIAWWQPELFALVALGVGSVILLGSLYKTITLAIGGGAAVATDLGGRLVPRDTSDPLERRLINVVEEMAIAAGMAVPPVYVLDEENAINAFAAGSNPSSSVVAVTRGTLEQLSREELQGVIAHEFSHILNGDMRLNMRILGVLHGILLLTIAGRIMLRSSSGNSKNAMPVVLLGVGLLVLGYIGVLFGELIKAAVSREREFLADASAVQFTRNPGGIANALRRIAGIGSTINNPRAETASHMFFGSSAKFAKLLSTHPPVLERIKRLQPGFDPDNAAPLPPAQTLDAAPVAPLASGFTAQTTTTTLEQVGQLDAAHIGHAQALMAELPTNLLTQLHTRQHAPAVLFALLLAPTEQTQVREAQHGILTVNHGPECTQQAQTHAAWLASLPRDEQARLRLPIIDLVLPTLQELPASSRDAVVNTVDALIHADGRTSMSEFLLRRLVRGHLLHDPARHSSSVNPAELKADLQLIMGWLVRTANHDERARQQAFAAATAQAPMDGPWHIPADTNLRDIHAVDRALAHLAACKPAFRKAVLRACIAAVEADGVITPREYELLRTVAQALDCPLPLPGPGTTQAASGNA